MPTVPWDFIFTLKGLSHDNCKGLLIPWPTSILYLITIFGSDNARSKRIDQIHDMSLVSILVLARTKEREGPNLLNSPEPSHVRLERGSKACMIRKNPVYGLSLVPCPHAGERVQGRIRAQLFFPFPSQRKGGEEKRASKFVLTVS
jgi:hypothetical protein